MSGPQVFDTLKYVSALVLELYADIETDGVTVVGDLHVSRFGTILPPETLADALDYWAAAASARLREEADQ